MIHQSRQRGDDDSSLPLVVSVANPQEPLYLANRSGNRPSHEGAAGYLDRAITLCRRAGFQRIVLRGDTDFSQTKHLDRWDTAGVQALRMPVDNLVRNWAYLGMTSLAWSLKA